MIQLRLCVFSVAVALAAPLASAAEYPTQKWRKVMQESGMKVN